MTQYTRYPALCGGSSFDPDAEAYFIAAGITNDTQKMAYNSFVLSAKSNGYYSKMLGCWPMIGGNAIAHAVNSINPGTYDLTFFGTPTQSSNGVAWNGTTQYADTGLANNITGQDDCHISYYSRTNTAAGGIEMGAYSSSGLTLLYDFGGYYVAMNNALLAESALADTLGFQSVSRSSGSTITAYHKGVKLGDFSQSSSAPLSLTAYLGGYNGGAGALQLSTKQCAFASRGTGLSDGEQAAFAIDVQTMQTALGRQV